jgi:hypothetical protein
MVLSTWSDFFEVSEPTLNQQQLYFSTHTPSASNVYVSNCLFYSCTSRSDGGALYCTTVKCLLIESSSFISCLINSYFGAAVYFVNRNEGQCVLHKVCGNNCSSTNTTGSSGQLVYAQVKDGVSNKNYVSYSSVSRCGNDTANSWQPVCLDYGKIHCPSINISMNRCRRYAAIHCCPFRDSSSVTCSILYSSIADNVAAEDICLNLYKSGANFEIKSCNIIRNTQVDYNSWALFFTDGFLVFKDSCIRENSARDIFWSSSGSITLSNCTVDKTTKFGSLIIQNTVTKSFIHAFYHLSVQNCHLEYDAIGTLTLKKEKQCNTCKKLSYQLPQEILLSLTNILIFNM